MTFLTGGAVYAAPLPDCGTTPASGQETVTGIVEKAGQPVTRELGRSDSGTRRVELEFVYTNCVPPSKVAVERGVFQGANTDLPEDAIAAPASVNPDGSLVRVTVTIHRGRVSPGEYTGEVRVGDSRIGRGVAQLVVKRQEPFVPWPFLLTLAAILGGILLGGIQHLYKGAPTPPQRSGTAPSGLSERAASSGRQALSWCGWTIRSLFYAIGKLVTTRNIWAAAVGLGAGVIAFVATYVNDPSWRLDLSSALALLVAVGTPTLAAAFAAWQAPGSNE